MEEGILPLYPYLCRRGHRFDVLAPMKDAGKSRRCPKCRSSSIRSFDTGGLNGVGMSEATLKTLVAPLGRRNVAQIKTAKDVDRVLAGIEQSYGKHVGKIGRVS